MNNDYVIVPSTVGYPKGSFSPEIPSSVLENGSLSPSYDFREIGFDPLTALSAVSALVYAIRQRDNTGLCPELVFTGTLADPSLRFTSSLQRNTMPGIQAPMHGITTETLEQSIRSGLLHCIRSSRYELRRILFIVNEQDYELKRSKSIFDFLTKGNNALKEKTTFVSPQMIRSQAESPKVSETILSVLRRLFIDHGEPDIVTYASELTLSIAKGIYK